MKRLLSILSIVPSLAFGQSDLHHPDPNHHGGAIGANTAHIVGAQTAASAAGDLVQGSATITIDGTAV